MLDGIQTMTKIDIDVLIIAIHDFTTNLWLLRTKNCKESWIENSSNCGFMFKLWNVKCNNHKSPVKLMPIFVVGWLTITIYFQSNIELPDHTSYCQLISTHNDNPIVMTQQKFTTRYINWWLSCNNNNEIFITVATKTKQA